MLTLLITIVTFIASIIITWLISSWYYKKSQKSEPEWYEENSSGYTLNFTEKRTKEILARRHSDLATMYQGALGTFYSQDSNKENIVQAANSFKGITDSLPHYLDLPRPVEGTELKKPEQFKKIVAQTSEVENLPRFVEKQDEDLANTWHELHEYFDSISNHKHYGQIKNDKFEEKVADFNSILLQALPQHYERKEEINRLMNLDDPREEDVQEALRLLRTEASFADFFSEVPLNWYNYLKQEGVFDNPPSVQSKQGTIRTPRWYPAVFLARTAKNRPDLFFKEVRKIPAENIRIMDDLIEGLLNLPINRSEEASRILVKWINTPYFKNSVTSARIEDLIKRWKEGKKYNAILNLFSPLTELQQLDDRDQSNSTPIGDIDLKNIRIYHLKNLLETIEISDMDFDLQRKLMDLFKTRLEECIDLGSNDTASKEVSSYIWRPAIEEHGQNSPTTRDVRHLLVELLRDTSSAVIDSKPVKAKEVIRTFLQSSYPLCRRIGIHLTRKNYARVQDLANRVAKQKEFFNRAVFHHEYYLFLKEHFGNLNDGTQEKVLSWISSMDGINDQSEEEDQRWQYRKLYPIKDYLKEDWEEKFEYLDRQFSKPNHPEFAFYSPSGWIGSKSPLTEDEISDLSLDEVKNYLLSWSPPQKKTSLGEQTPSVNGLANTLTQDVQARPKKYASQVLVFKDERINPYYLRSIFSGFSNAVEDGKGFNWEGILKLGAWASTIDWDEVENLDNSAHRLRHMVRKSIGWLLQKGFRSDNNIIPGKHEKVVWEIIKSLLKDPEPDPSYEEDRDIGNRPPTEIAINTIRGTAVELLFQYCIWVSKFSKREQLNIKFLSNKSELPKKAANKIEKHLDPDFDPSISVHSLYGMYFGHLYNLDKDWISKRSQLVFPKDDFKRWASAWGAFLKFNKPHKDLFDLLYTHYKKASANVPREDKNNNTGYLGHYTEYNRHLTGHIIASYWSGEENFKEGGLLSTFLKNSPDSARASAVRHLKNNLKRFDISSNSAEWAKCESYWRKRIKKAKDEIDSKSFEEEMLAFISWLEYIPTNVENSKILNLLKETLKLDINVGEMRIHELIPHLAIYSEENPFAIGVLEKIIEKSDRLIWIRSLKEDSETILENALKSDNFRKKALSVINELGNRGIDDFEDLWKEYQD